MLIGKQNHRYCLEKLTDAVGVGLVPSQEVALGLRKDFSFHINILVSIISYP